MYVVRYMLLLVCSLCTADSNVPVAVYSRSHLFNILGPRGVQITETLRYVKHTVYKAGHFPFNAQHKEYHLFGGFE